MPQPTADDLFNIYAESKRAEFVKKADDIFGFDNPKEIVKHTVPYTLGGAGIGALLGILREYMSADDTATGTNMDALKTILTGALLGAGTGTSLGYFTSNPRYRTLKDAQDDSTQEDVDDNVTPTTPATTPTATTPTTSDEYKDALTLSRRTMFSLAERLTEADPEDLAAMLPQLEQAADSSGQLTASGQEATSNLALANKLIEAAVNYRDRWAQAKADGTVVYTDKNGLKAATKLLSDYADVTYPPAVRDQLYEALQSGDGVTYLTDDTNPIAMVNITNPADGTNHVIAVPYTDQKNVPIVLESNNFDHKATFRLSPEAAAKRAATIHFSQPDHINMDPEEKQENIDTLASVLILPKWYEGLEAGGERQELLTGWMKGQMNDTLWLTRALRETDIFVSPGDTSGNWEVYHRGEDGERRLGGYTRGYISSVLDLSTENIVAGLTGVGAGFALQHPSAANRISELSNLPRRIMRWPSLAQSSRTAQELLHNLSVGNPLTPDNIEQIYKQYMGLLPDHKRLIYEEFRDILKLEHKIRTNPIAVTKSKDFIRATPAERQILLKQQQALADARNAEIDRLWKSRIPEGSPSSMTQAERLAHISRKDIIIGNRGALQLLQAEVNPGMKGQKPQSAFMQQLGAKSRPLANALRFVGLPFGLGLAGWQGAKALVAPDGPLVYGGDTLYDRPRHSESDPYLSSNVRGGNPSLSSRRYSNIPDLQQIHQTLYPTLQPVK